jgi:hypothetical protein
MAHDVKVWPQLRRASGLRNILKEAKYARLCTLSTELSTKPFSSLIAAISAAAAADVDKNLSLELEQDIKGLHKRTKSCPEKGG